MGTKIEVACNGCDATGSIDLDMDIVKLNVGGEINISQPCPLCGGKFGAPGGHYERNEAGVMKRTGDFTPPEGSED